MTESLLLLLLLPTVAAALWFAHRSAGVESVRTERDKAQTELSGLRAENARLASALAAEKATAQARSEEGERREQALRTLQAEMEKTFQVAATQALDASQQRFMATANEVFEKHREAAAGGVKEVLLPAQEALAKLAGSVDALDKARIEDKSTLTEQMTQIRDVVARTRDETSKLMTVLRTSPKARGRWGEESLRNVLELSGLSKHLDFVEQTAQEGDAGRTIRPDVIVRLPGERCIVIDSKVALSGYIDSLEATDDAAREACLVKHAQELRTHMKALASKEYWRHVPTSADFVVMYVGGENFFAAAIERDPTIIEDAFANAVVIVTPVTMFALAKAIAYGWRQEQSAQNAQEIADSARDLYRRLAAMWGHVGDLGKSLGSAVDRYNGFVGSLDRSVMPQARKFRELGAAEGAEIVIPPQIEGAPRPVPAPEQLELTPPPQAAPRRSRA